MEKNGDEAQSSKLKAQNKLQVPSSKRASENSLFRNRRGNEAHTSFRDRNIAKDQSLLTSAATIMRACPQPDRAARRLFGTWILVLGISFEL